ncbi:MAG: hypothetical protein JJU03_07880 [Idiomarina sp.]|nr:hypothetical protein [Idiomarina sp.]
MECLVLEDSATVQLQLHAAENYENCFQVEGYEGYETISFFLLGHDGIEQQLRVFRASVPQAGVIATSDDDAEQIHSVVSTLPDDGVVFTLSSKGDWQADKLVSVSVVAVETPELNEVFVYIELER